MWNLFWNWINGVLCFLLVLVFNYTLLLDSVFPVHILNGKPLKWNGFYYLLEVSDIIAVQWVN